MKQQQMANNLEILILAAGKGTRMNSDTPKVLQPLLGIPMIEHVVEKSLNLKPKKNYDDHSSRVNFFRKNISKN